MKVTRKLEFATLKVSLKTLYFLENLQQIFIGINIFVGIFESIEGKFEMKRMQSHT